MGGMDVGVTEAACLDLDAHPSWTEVSDRDLLDRQRVGEVMDDAAW